MPKKFTYELVRNYFDTKNCTLLSEHYENQLQKLDYICECGNKSSISFNAFKRGQRCKDCGLSKRHISTRKSLENVKQIFSAQGCLLLSTEYKNNKQLLDYICVCGTKHRIRLNDFLNGVRCRNCLSHKLSETNLLPYEYVKEEFNKRGCQLISEIYKGNNKKLKYICICGNQSEVTFDHFINSNVRCEECSKAKLRDKLAHSYSYIKRVFEENGCTLLSNEYVNSSSLLDYVCSCGNISKISYDNFRSGHKCNKCGSQKRTVSIRETMYKNNTSPVSTQQLYLYQIYNGELNYPVDKFSLDIAFLKEKIYVEYDGSGHNLSTKLGDCNKEEFEIREMRRSQVLQKKGWKEIRIISRKDFLPDVEKLSGMLVLAKQYLDTGRHYIKFDIDNGKVVTSQYIKDYDFGEIKLINKANYSINNAT